MSFYTQPLSYQCGPFALKYALVTLGLMEDEKIIEDEAGSTWWSGTNEIGLAKAAKYFDCTLEETLTDSRSEAFETLDDALAEKYPAILCVDKWSHWITVINRDKGQYIIVDSALKKVITPISSRKLVQRWKYLKKDNPKYSIYILYPNFRARTRARINMAIANKLMSEKYNDLAIRWDIYFNYLIEMGRNRNPLAEYTMTFKEFLRRNQKSIVEAVADWHGEIEYAELNHIMDNFNFVASVYDIMIHMNDEKRTVIDLVALLTLHSTDKFGSYSVF